MNMGKKVSVLLLWGMLLSLLFVSPALYIG